MDKGYTYLFDEHGLLLKSTMQRYAQASLSAQEVRAVEMHISRDEFAADALEGFLLQYADEQSGSHQAQQPLLKLSYKKPLAAAAMLALLVGGGYLYSSKQQDKIVQNTAGKTQATAPKINEQATTQEQDDNQGVANTIKTVTNTDSVVTVKQSAGQKAVAETPQAEKSIDGLSSKEKATQNAPDGTVPPIAVENREKVVAAEQESVPIQPQLKVIEKTSISAKDDNRNVASDENLSNYNIDNQAYPTPTTTKSGPSRNATGTSAKSIKTKKSAAAAPSIAVPSKDVRNQADARTNDKLQNLDNARILYQNKNYEAALTAFKKIKNVGSLPESEEADFYIALCQINLGDRKKGTKALRSIGKSKSTFASQAQLWLKNNE